MVKPKIHMIGNAHIDPVWLWVWQDGLEVAQSTCRDAVSLLSKYPDYIFSRSSAAIYRWIEKSDPQLFGRIRSLVKEGRWNIVNGWWVQPDCNIPCGESLIRQGLYGQLYFKERFDKMASVGFNVDTFGHCGTLPQILRKCGLNSYVFHRPGIREKDLPNDLFWWESPDGSRILGCRIESYDAGSIKHLEEKVGRSLRRCRETGIDTMCFYGKGDHGGGPTKEMIFKIRELAKGVDDVDIRFSTPDDFFETIRALAPELPVVSDDLQHHSRGCYTVVSEIKAENRRLEVSLLDAERFCSAAWLLLGVEYPRGVLRRSWETLLFHQFHDVMGGTCIKPACDYAIRAMKAAREVSDSERRMAMAALSSKIRTDCHEGKQLLVYNPAPCGRIDPIEFQAVLPHGEDLVAVDELQREHQVQILSSEDFEGNRMIRAIFLGELPPLGYRVFWIKEGVSGGSDIGSTENSIENSMVRLTIDPEMGYLVSILDKRNGLEFLGAPSIPIVIKDESDTWSHDVEEFRDEIGSFHIDGSPEIDIGPVQASIRIPCTYGRSKLVLTYYLNSGQPLIRCKIDLEWHERHKMLKMSYPVALRDPRAIYEIPYGTIERPTEGQEEPGQRWIDLVGRSTNGSEMGLLLLNDSKYGFDVLESELRISLVRSPIYAFHRPRKVESGKRYLYTDQGKHTIGLAILPHATSGTEANFSLAEGFNNPPMVAFSNRHDGPLPSTASFVTSQPSNVLIGTMKLAEEKDALTIRLFECAGKKTESTLLFPLTGVKFETIMAPWEVKTMVIDRDGEVLETDMLERPIEESTSGQ